MSVETFKPEDSVSVTAAAQEHFRGQLQGQQDQAGIRLSIKESGCTGYMYVVDIADGPEAEDLSMQLDNGVKLYVDTQALPVIRGTVIDMTREGLNHTLSFNNPNVAEECGCGESFSIS